MDSIKFRQKETHRGNAANRSQRPAGAVGQRRAGVVGMMVTLLTLTIVLSAWADRTPLKPGWNLLSPEQDIQIGRQQSQLAEKQLPLLNDARVDAYLNKIGGKLYAHVPPGTPKYPYQYKCVNTMDINAFALPGGFIYINRGIIENADDEAQLAGVMAHETSHVVLRHGTSQASKQQIAQAPLSILGGMLGNNSIVSAIAQAGAGFAMNSVFLKYSRTDESQADILGTQILYDTNYDPRAMAQFFEKIQAESKGQPPEFFSNHPNPEHRIERVQQEVDNIGGPPAHYQKDSAEFQEIKRYVHSLPAPPPAGAAGQRAPGAAGNAGRPAAPSSRVTSFQNNEARFNHPENWKSYGQGSAVTLAPEGGVLDDGQGNAALAYGAIVSVFEPQSNSGGPMSLDDATDQFLAGLQKSNPHMTPVHRRERMRLGGQEASSVYLSNDSPAGGREADWIVTTLRPNGLFYIVCAAPEKDYPAYEPAFKGIVDSLRFPQ